MTNEVVLSLGAGDLSTSAWNDFSAKMRSVARARARQARPPQLKLFSFLPGRGEDFWILKLVFVPSPKTWQKTVFGLSY
jgi:hypothetical protein